MSNPLETMTLAEQEHYDERAGIAEFDHGLTRQEAERIALACVWNAHGQWFKDMGRSAG